MALLRSARALAFSGVLLGLVACDSDVVTPDDDGSITPPFVEGSRLEARVQAAGDAELFLGWFDPELDIPCRFIAVTGSVVVRCAPDRNDPSAGYITNNEIVYADASCTQPLRIALADVEPPPLVLGEETLDASGCGVPASVDVNELGPRAAPPEQIFYRFGDACEPGGPVSDTYALYELGPKVAPEELVGATEENETRDPRLAARVLHADDDSREIVGAFDLERDSACWLGPFGEDDGPCVPFTLAFATGSQFGDDTCESEPLAYASDVTNNSTTCEASTVAVVLTDGCDWIQGFTSLGEEVERPYLLDSASMTCSLASDEELEGHRYFHVGDPLGDDAFPALELVSFGEGRVQVHAISAPDGSPLIGIGFFDTELGVPCSATEMCDGTLRCAPNPSFTDVVNGPFRDDACTESLFVTGTACDDSQIPRIVFTGDFAECTASADFHERGPEYDGTIHYFDETTGCVAGERDPGSLYYELGPEIPIDSMPEIEERTGGS